MGDSSCAAKVKPHPRSKSASAYTTAMPLYLAQVGRGHKKRIYEYAPVEDAALVSHNWEDIHEVEHALEVGGRIEDTHDILDVPNGDACERKTQSPAGISIKGHLRVYLTLRPKIPDKRQKCALPTHRAPPKLLRVSSCWRRKCKSKRKKGTVAGQRL